MLKGRYIGLIRSDFKRYGKSNFSTFEFLTIFFSHPEFRFLVNHRLANAYSRRHPIGLMARLWYRQLKSRFGMQILLKVDIGKGFLLNHWGPMNIGHGIIIGENCNISQGVTIGNISRGRNKGSPVIGDKVWIGANAVVVGKIRIGNNVLIGPSSLVNFDVPDNSVVIGNPGKVVSQKGSEGYIKNLS